MICLFCNLYPGSLTLILRERRVLLSLNLIFDITYFFRKTAAVISLTLSANYKKEQYAVYTQLVINPTANIISENPKYLLF